MRRFPKRRYPSRYHERQKFVARLLKFAPVPGGSSQRVPVPRRQKCLAQFPPAREQIRPVPPPYLGVDKPARGRCPSPLLEPSPGPLGGNPGCHHLNLSFRQRRPQAPQPPAILFVFVAVAVEYVFVWMFTFGILSSLQRATSRKTKYEAWLSGALHIMLILGTLLGRLLGLLVQIARHVFPALLVPGP